MDKYGHITKLIDSLPEDEIVLASILHQLEMLLQEFLPLLDMPQEVADR